MLGRPVMQITCDAAPLFVLGLKQAASRLTQRSFSLTPFPSMDEQRNDQEKLCQHDRDAGHYAPPVLFPRSRYSVFDNTAGWEIALGKLPPLELSPVEHVNTGSRCFQDHLRRSFAAEDLYRCIGSDFSGLRPTYHVAANGARSNVSVRCRINRRCRSIRQFSHYVERNIAVPCRIAAVFNR